MNRTIDRTTVNRYLTLKTHKIRSLPVVILMPHSSCNCRCVMCDIWQSNGRARSLDEADIQQLLDALRQLQTRWVVMSGGEALMNRKLFTLCRMLQAEGMKVTILSTGILLKKFAREVIAHSDEVIVSLDGSAAVHDAIRRIPNAYQKLAGGVTAVKTLQPDFPISARCVIQRLNITDWPHIVEAAHELGLDQISFLPADISTDAFNRPALWTTDRQAEILPRAEELPQLQAIIESLINDFAADFENGFIAESPAKIRQTYDYYAAFHGERPFPPVNCNAPWVSTVIEADGTVRPCFFHAPIGNIHDTNLIGMLNRPEVISFRQNLNTATDPICRKCVCTLNLAPTARIT